MKNIFKLANFKDKVLWLIFGLFIVVTLFGLVNHAPWRDEAQSWLIVRDLRLSGVINQMPYEGTPPLWHLLLFPLAKLGLPYASEAILHYLLSLFFIFVFLFFSPLPRKIKFILPFTYYFLFEYTIIARNYNLTACLLFAIAALHLQRFKYPLVYAPLIFLLAWTNVHSLAISILLSSYFVYEIIKRRQKSIKYIIAVAVMSLGIISAALMLTPQVDQFSGLYFFGWRVIARSLAFALLPFLKDLNISVYLLCLISLAWVPLIILMLKKRASKIIFIISYLWLAFIFLFKHSGDLRHFGLILIFFVFAWWIDLAGRNKDENEQSANKQCLKYQVTLYLLVVILGVNVIYAGYFYYENYIKNFSGAKEMAQYINDNNLTDQKIAAYPAYCGTALLPYLPGKKFYQMESMREGTFMTWDNLFLTGLNIPYPILKNYLKYYYSLPSHRADSVLILSTTPEASDPELRLIFKNTKPSIKKDEFFYLYRLQL